MKKCSWQAGSLAMCSCFGVGATALAAAAKQQSEAGKEIAAEIGRTHGIWGGFVDYAVLAAWVLALLSLLWSWYVRHEMEQRLRMLDQKRPQESDQVNMALHIQSSEGRDIHSMKKEIDELKTKISSLENVINALPTESRNKPNANTGTETSHIYDNYSSGEWQHDTMPYDETKADDFIREYNALYDMREGLEQKRKQTALENDPRLRRFSCSNDRERLYNSDIAPIFESRSNGMYMAYDLGNNYYAVLPAYATYENSKHVTYAMKEVFDSNYEGEAYTKIEVVKPAIFVVSDDKWKLYRERKGKLVLKK